MNPPSNDDLPFHHYSRKHRLIAWVSRTLFDQAVYTVRHGMISGMRRKGGLGWVPDSLWHQAESREERFWRSLNLTRLTVYDIGAFEGLLTLFFARSAARVISYEPNRRNRQRLLENLQLNRIGNVTVRDVGLGSSPGKAELVYMPLMPGGASIDGLTVRQLRNSGTPIQEEKIEIATLDQDIADHNLPPPDFIKIDIEGLEIEALRGARETLRSHQPALFLEMHGETMAEKRRKVTEIVRFLWDAGYRFLHHVESGASITPENTATAVEGHIFGTAASTHVSLPK